MSYLIRPQSVADKLQFQAVILVFITSNFIVSRFFASCKAKNVLLGLFVFYFVFLYGFVFLIQGEILIKKVVHIN